MYLEQFHLLFYRFTISLKCHSFGLIEFRLAQIFYSYKIRSAKKTQHAQKHVILCRSLSLALCLAFAMKFMLPVYARGRALEHRALVDSCVVLRISPRLCLRLYMRAHPRVLATNNKRAFVVNEIHYDPLFTNNTDFKYVYDFLYKFNKNIIRRQMI